MVSVTLSIPPEVKHKMEKYSEINWSGFIRKAIIEKRSKDIGKFLGEINWYLELPKNLQPYIPRIFETSLDINNPFIKMEYYGYPNLSDVYVWGSHNLRIWSHIFNSIFSVIEDMKNYQIEENKDKINETLVEIYYEKTVNRLNELKNNPLFSNLFENKITINSKSYESLNFYMDKIKKYKIWVWRDSNSWLSKMSEQLPRSPAIFPNR